MKRHLYDAERNVSFYARQEDGLQGDDAARTVGDLFERSLDSTGNQRCYEGKDF